MVSVEKYLHTVYDGADREYLDGEIVERNMGNKSHGRVQGTFIYLLRLLEQRTGIFVIPELRHKVTISRYRIPDVAVFASEPESEARTIRRSSPLRFFRQTTELAMSSPNWTSTGDGQSRIFG